jgi:hypothetical protein
MPLMPIRSCFAATLLASALLAACVGTPDDVARLNGDRPLVQRSEHGLVDATVALEGSEIARGVNDFSITLRATDGSTRATLKSVDATMAVHGHRADASNIVSDGDAFHTDLDLFMSGRWQIALGVELETSSDLIEFALDVP